MNVIAIIIATVVVGGTGIILGMLLGLFGEKFKVEVDEREGRIRGELPGNNCGGCGFAGCDALAQAIVKKEASVDACPVGGSQAADRIAAIMGVDSKKSIRRTAFVKCAGNCELARDKYVYYGIEDCAYLEQLPNQSTKECRYGCTGYGNCVKACPFDAIHVVDGIAVVDKEACKACGKCVAACPKHLIALVPYDAKYLVRCSSKDKGKDVLQKCDIGCIGCGICGKVCEQEAIQISDNLAAIDYEKCIQCGNCVKKCPKAIITGKETE